MFILTILFCMILTWRIKNYEKMLFLLDVRISVLQFLS